MVECFISWTLFDTALEDYPTLSSRLCPVFESAIENFQRCEEAALSDDEKAALVPIALSTSKEIHEEEQLSFDRRAVKWLRTEGTFSGIHMDTVF